MPKYKNHINSKLPKLGTTIFSVMSALANEHKAINLSQGFPNFDVSPKLIELTSEAMRSGKNQYAPMPGVKELREVVCEKVEALYGTAYDPETEITVTSGATQAIYTAITATVREGDEVVIFTPAYDCYEPAIELNGGKAVYVKLKAPTYGIDWDEVKKVVNRKTRMIIINTPHNPTGATISASDMQQLEKLTRSTDILVLSDEVYEHIIFDGATHQSAALYPGLAERSFIVASFGKTFHATGWKMGYCLAPAALMAEFRKSHQFIVFTVNTPVQYAMAEYLKDSDTYTGLPSFYQEKRDYFVNLIKDSRFTVEPAAGTYFQLLGYKDISEEADTAFAKRLTIEKGIASIPVSVFYHQMVDDKVLRFCFAKDNETLEKAAEIINSI
jgi:methionine aminotransferase